jgi:hypothetical protein
MLLTLFSNNEAVFDIPFSQKTKEQKFLINNFMISKSFSNVILKEALTIIEAEKFARKYEWMPANLCTGDR